MNRFLGLALAAALSPMAASAGEITLAAPLHGATLHGDVADMAVYYLANDGSDAIHVVAVYADKSAPGERSQLMMEMNDGDAVRFAMPDRPEETYSFARQGDNLTVTSAPATFHGQAADS